jgi:general secretion pathway protein J
VTASAFRPEENGFTLLELLVSITLLAFLSLALVTGLRFGTQVWNKSQTANVDTNAMRSAQTWIERSVAGIYPEYVVASPTDAFVVFDGTAARMRYLSTIDAPDGGLAQVTLEASTQDGGEALEAEVASDLAKPHTSPAVIVLLRQLGAVEFAYFGAREGEKVPVWHRSWQHERSLPLLIRVRAAMPRPSAPWSELVIRPKIAADVSCNFNPVTHFCSGRS